MYKSDLSETTGGVYFFSICFQTDVFQFKKTRVRPYFDTPWTKEWNFKFRTDRFPPVTEANDSIQ